MYIRPDREMRTGCYRNKEALMWQCGGRRGGERDEVERPEQL